MGNHVIQVQLEMEDEMRLLLTIALLAALAAPVYAAADNAATEQAPAAKQKTEKGPKGGFRGPISGAKAETVEKAKTLADDAAVVLTGSLVSREAAQKDIYIFKDTTGDIKVKIERKVFRGNTITPENEIRIAGKVDKEDGKDIEIDVKNLEILK